METEEEPEPGGIRGGDRVGAYGVCAHRGVGDAAGWGSRGESGEGEGLGAVGVEVEVLFEKVEVKCLWA